MAVISAAQKTQPTGGASAEDELKLFLFEISVEDTFRKTAKLGYT